MQFFAFFVENWKCNKFDIFLAKIWRNRGLYNLYEYCDYLLLSMLQSVCKEWKIYCKFTKSVNVIRDESDIVVLTTCDNRTTNNSW